MLPYINDLSAQPAHLQIAQGVVARILEGDLPLGTQLVPPRLLARQQRVSVSTVERAYRELAREGVVVARDDSAFVVQALSPQQRQAHAIRRLLADEAARHLLEDDLVLAREIQTALSPVALPKDDQLEIAACSSASRAVSGDFHACLPIDAARFGLAIGDAAGKGLPAALLIAQIQALLKAGIGDGLPRVLSVLNAQLLDLGAKARCATLFCAVYDRSAGRLEYVNAGHNSPVLLHAAGSHELLETGGMLLGALPEAAYQTAHVSFQPGDLLLAYTDGVTETFSPAGELYGEGRVLELLARCRGQSAAETVAELEADVSAFRGSAAAQDDLTALAVRKL